MWRTGTFCGCTIMVKQFNFVFCQNAHKNIFTMICPKEGSATFC